METHLGHWGCGGGRYRVIDSKRARQPWALSCEAGKDKFKQRVFDQPVLPSRQLKDDEVKDTCRETFARPRFGFLHEVFDPFTALLAESRGLGLTALNPAKAGLHPNECAKDLIIVDLRDYAKVSQGLNQANSPARSELATSLATIM